MVSENYGVITMTNHTIINTNFQTTNFFEPDVKCALCEEPILDGQISSTGPYNANGELTFICIRHKQNFRQLLNLFADFRTAQRQHFSERAIVTSEVAPDAWFLH